MKPAEKPDLSDSQSIHLLPHWVSSVRAETPETVAFLSGAALAMLDLVLRDPGGTLPSALLRDRLALDAAVTCLKLENRNENPAAIRDAVCLARAGEALGPAGDMFMVWRKLARINLASSGWKDRVVKLLPDQVVEEMPELGSFVGSPVGQAGQILEVVLRQFPRQEAAALMLADVTLARAVGWERPMPLLATHLTRKDIRTVAVGEIEATLCGHRAMIAACDGAIRSAADLSRRAEKLRAITPKLRAKGAGEAVQVFLSRDAVMAAALINPADGVGMTDRAARRLCDRLVELGVVSELTGRSTFRLYGV